MSVCEISIIQKLITTLSSITFVVRNRSNYGREVGNDQELLKTRRGRRGKYQSFSVYNPKRERVNEWIILEDHIHTGYKHLQESSTEWHYCE